MLKLIKNKISYVSIFLLLFIFLIASVQITKCASVVDNEGNPQFIVNFDSSYDVSNITLNNRLLLKDTSEVNQKLSSTAQNIIESVAKDKFNSEYEISSLVLFQLYSNDTGSLVRLNDFNNLTSIEMVVGYTGDVSQMTNDAFCAIFIPLDEDLESRVLSGDYSAFDGIQNNDCVPKAITSTPSNNEQIVLTMDADSDGFVFLLSLVQNEGNMGTIILVVGIVISVVLVALILWTIRGYVLEKRRRKGALGVQDISELTNKLKDKNTNSNIDKNNKSFSKVEINKSNQSTNLSSPNLPAKPKLPTVKKNAQNQNIDSKKDENS